MIEADWLNCKLLKPTMNWGDATKMNKWLVLETDVFLQKLGRSFIVSCGTNKVHLAHSQHASGDAVDICFPGMSKRDLFDAFLCASRFKFMGIGVYPDWNDPGLHLDWRKAPYRALWLGFGTIKQDYLALDLNNILTHVVRE